jgi:Na+-translocating ferredoxin:NAD+ oxidoreductase RnfC subunit
MDKAQLLELVRNAGVVGAGGAGFPTHVKLAADNVEYVIVNGAECEPLLRVDQQLMEVYTGKLVDTLNAIVSTLGAEKGVFALKGKYKNAVKALDEYIGKHDNLEFFELKDFYPAGDEHVLVYEVTGRIVPEGGIPLMVGCVVINVETLLNISNAFNQIPVTHTYVTVTGMVARPTSFRAPVGVSFQSLVDAAGGGLVSDYVIIDGGPMMGKIKSNLSKPITKTTKGVIVLPSDHPLVLKKDINLGIAIKRAMSVCCQCRFCTDMCPRNLLGHALEPHKVLRTVGYGIATDSAALTQSFLCSDCGVCDLFACPMHLSPRLMNMELKREFGTKGFKNPHTRSDLKARSNRELVRIPIKRLIARLGIDALDVPAPLDEGEMKADRVVLLLSQHIGVPSIPVVKNGDVVKEGQLVADIPQNRIGARIHAPIAGTVRLEDAAVVIEA